jgi:hypothetical protein
LLLAFLFKRFIDDDMLEKETLTMLQTMCTLDVWSHVHPDCSGFAAEMKASALFRRLSRFRSSHKPVHPVKRNVEFDETDCLVLLSLRVRASLANSQQHASAGHWAATSSQKIPRPSPKNILTLVWQTCTELEGHVRGDIVIFHSCLSV